MRFDLRILRLLDLWRRPWWLPVSLVSSGKSLSSDVELVARIASVVGLNVWSRTLSSESKSSWLNDSAISSLEFTSDAVDSWAVTEKIILFK